MKLRKHHLTLAALILGAMSLLSILFVATTDLNFFQVSRDEIFSILNNFASRHEPILTVNFSEIYGGDGQAQLLHPLFDVHTLQWAKTAPACAGGETISPGDRLSEMQEDTSSSKMFALEQYLNHQQPLPPYFISTPPLIDENGTSFAYHLSRKGSAPFNQKAWAEDHLAYFKSSELSDVLERFQIKNPQYEVIARLTSDEIETIARGSELVLNERYLLVKDQSRYGFSPLRYQVYSAREVSTFLRASAYDFAPLSSEALCLQKIGNLCWTYNSNHALTYLHKYSIAIGGLLAAVLVLSIGFYFRDRRERNIRDHRQRLAIQILSHEFRTPVATILLLLEELAKDFPRLTPASQDHVTQISGETFRLQRVIEMSKSYMQANNRELCFHTETIPSLNTWMSDFVFSSNNKILLVPLEKDISIRADSFWLNFILSNLIKNAIDHGKEPIHIHLSVQKSSGRKRVRFSVIDSGVCEFDSIGGMSEAFVKSQQSKGMGLGLNITRSVVEEWGGKMEFAKNPTTFAVTLSELGN